MLPCDPRSTACVGKGAHHVRRRSEEPRRRTLTGRTTTGETSGVARFLPMPMFVREVKLNHLQNAARSEPRDTTVLWGHRPQSRCGLACPDAGALIGPAPDHGDSDVTE